jgi:hypothetical protein
LSKSETAGNTRTADIFWLSTIFHFFCHLLEWCRAIIKSCRADFSSNRNSSSSPCPLCHTINRINLIFLSTYLNLWFSVSTLTIEDWSIFRPNKYNNFFLTFYSDGWTKFPFQTWLRSSTVPSRPAGSSGKQVSSPAGTIIW